MALDRLLLEKLKRNTLKDTAGDDLLTYVPLQATCPEQRFVQRSEEKKRNFDLLEKVRETFIGSDRYSVLLLSGDSGAGKSCFSRYLTEKLWEAYEDRGILRTSKADIPFTMSPLFI